MVYGLRPSDVTLITTLNNKLASDLQQYQAA